MRRFVILTMLCAVLLALACAGAAAATPVRSCPVAAAAIATFDPGVYGSFAEGMAADSHGNLYVSLTTYDLDTNHGEIWRIAPTGAKRVVASMDLTPYGQFMGVAVDRCDNVYVAYDDFSREYGVEPVIGASVWRVQGNGTLCKAVALPNAHMPNGLAFHGRDLYVTDSWLGAVWRVRMGAGVASPTQPWLQSALLAPGDPATHPTMTGLGANGIAFDGDQVFVDVSDYGRVVRIPIRMMGAPGTPAVVCETDALMTADGMAFDALGRLWITTNSGTKGMQQGGGLYRLSPSGRLTTVADDPGWLDYPTMPVFGTTARTCGTLYVANGAYYFWLYGTAPSVIAIKAGIHGAPRG